MTHPDAEDRADQAAGRAGAYQESLRRRPLAFESTLRGALATCHPKLTRGQVWCRACGRIQKVDSGASLARGWPTCCGQTMTIDSPEEQRGLGSGGAS